MMRSVPYILSLLLLLTLPLSQAQERQEQTLHAIPEQWPAALPRPEGLSNIGGTLTTDKQRSNIDLYGRTSQNGDQYYQHYVAALKDKGFSELSNDKTFDMNRGRYEKGNYYLSVGTDIVNANTAREYTEFSINLIISQ